MINGTDPQAAAEATNGGGESNEVKVKGTLVEHDQVQQAGNGVAAGEHDQEQQHPGYQNPGPGDQEQAQNFTPIQPQINAAPVIQQQQPVLSMMMQRPDPLCFLRCRGLPYSASEADVRKFFSGIIFELIKIEK